MFTFLFFLFFFISRLWRKLGVGVCRSDDSLCIMDLVVAVGSRCGSCGVKSDFSGGQEYIYH